MPARRRLRTLCLAVLATVGLISPLSAASANAPSRILSDVDLVLAPGTTGTVPNTVPTKTIPPNPDIFLLADTTSSMGAPIANVRRNAAALLSTVYGAQPSARFGVAEYRDVAADPVSFRVNQPLTANPDSVVAGIRQWAATGGGDVPEDAINALYRLSTTDGRFRSGRNRTIVWIGDAPSHNPSNRRSIEQTANALRAAGIRVLAVDLGRLNAFGQARSLAENTGGALLGDAPASTVSKAILSGIGEVRVMVRPKLTRCDPELSLLSSPAKRTVVSGQTANFDQHITVASGAEPGDYQCTVRYLLNGKPSAQADTITVRVRGFSIDDVTVKEGGHYHRHSTEAVFTVRLNGPSTEPVSVAYTAVGGSASIPEDLAPASGRITFPPGTTSRRLVVKIKPDKLDEPKEMFTVNLSSSRGAGISDAVGVGTIVDDD